MFVANNGPSLSQLCKQTEKISQIIFEKQNLLRLIKTKRVVSELILANKCPRRHQEYHHGRSDWERVTLSNHHSHS
ncbi:hypothetical protein BKA69DRAFT_1069614 [Paraphysoderma sedebokerense]|nr:hypothetical protein BKA69DRAFT_1069614 [Paraphysoderma sedebokerense]